MANRRSSQLADAMRECQLMRFTRRFEESSVKGYVVDIGSRFFLLALVSDRIWYDGYECFRIRDVSNLRPDPYTAFIEKALTMRGERKPKRPAVNVDSMEELLRSASQVFPLVTIHREEIDPDVCGIGRVVNIERGRVSLLEINPDATWEAMPCEYRLTEITRVNFGGEYEDALHIVGGNPLADQPVIREAGQ